MCLLPTTSPGLLYCLLPPQAYCHPHSLTEYNLYMKRLEDDAMTRARFRRRVLCHSLAGNAVELLTITSFTADPEALKSRKGVVPQPAGGVARLSPRLAPYCWQRPVGSALLAAPCWHRSYWHRSYWHRSLPPRPPGTQGWPTWATLRIPKEILGGVRPPRRPRWQQLVPPSARAWCTQGGARRAVHAGRCQQGAASRALPVVRR